MKVKELHKNVNVAWSPQAHYPLLLAAGTAAQQLDASFSTSASLDLYSLNLQQPGYDMQLSASVPSDERFHKIVWGAYGNDPAGIIVGGCDQGKIKIYSAAKVLAKDSNSLLSSPERHKGPVKAMDLNPFQSNLLATGSTESEIFIWDLNNLSTPMSPGPKSMPAEDVQHIAWNEQVEHILASTFSQRCVIWDLRKNEAIIKLHDANSRVRWKSVQWHPDVATQLCLASEDDQSPIIELWDLRFATSPLKTLHNHQRGVLAIAWNQQDSDLLLSCAKDNRILCWNPNSDAPNGEVVCELAQTSQWNFDVLWCPRHPDLVVGTSFDGVATVYSILGGHNQQSAVTSNKIVESFPGMDPFTQPPPSAVHHTDEASILKKAPKWLKKPFGASFGFGGKLTTFENLPVDPNMPANTNRRVYVSQVITNPDLIQRSNELEAAVKTGQFSDFCKGKADNAKDEHTRKVWNCIGAYFGENVSQELLELLGFELENMNNKLNQFVPHPEIENVTKGIENLNNTGYAQNQPLQRKSIPGMPQAQSNMFNPIQPPAQSNMFNPIQPPTQSNMFNPIQPPNNASSMPPQQPSWNTAPTKQSFNNSSMNYPGVANNQSYPSTQPVTPFVPSVPQAPPSMMQDPYTPQAPLTPAIPPPPPTSATNLSQSSGSRPGSVGPQSKSKYVVDPSVKSGSTYGPGGYGSASGFSPTGGYGYSGMQQPQPSYPSPNVTPQQVQQPSLYTPTPVAAQTLAPSAYTYPNDTPSYQSGNQSSGWNDPPIYSKSNKAQPKTEFQQQNPIMHPLGGATHMTEPTVYQPDPNYQQHQQMGPQGTYNQFNFAPGMQSYNRAAEPPIQPAQIVRVPEPEKPKAPIPEEHKKLQSTFNELKDRCFEVARNPQLKKKIEDVSRKLEVFYDYLREQKISPSTLQGLHQICDTVQTGDYQGGLSIHTQLVSGPDFSQIASFMPGIKVLLQTALQLNVYLR
ncbi:unnamed protein product [Trichogramma brassicae]|uniref:Protein transport protein Sec31A n=1 Tax=Trichogramma brassicae TaxID=86971 RepID=A0A6H5ILX9_9HYME|nr:unnamed protein product [Trichogramma brassicae]